MWEPCRILVRLKWAKANDEALTTLQIGPFHLAMATECESFILVLMTTVIPAAYRILCGGLSPSAAATAILTPLLSMAGVLATSTAKVDDPVSWLTLLAIKRENECGRFPTAEEVSEILTAQDRSITLVDVQLAIRDLAEATSTVGDKRVFLLKHHVNGTLESLV